MTKHKTAAHAKARKAPARTAASRIRKTWDASLSAVMSAEKDAEKQIRHLMKKNKVSPKDATAALKTLTARIQKERKKAMKEMEARLATLQVRLKKERHVVGRMVDEAVHGTLVALNIPSRHEVSELTRKVDELSRKIDHFRRGNGGARPRTVRRTAVPVVPMS